MPRETASFEAAVAQSIQDWLTRTMPAVAESLGPLPDTVEPTRKEKLERWSLRTDQVAPGPMTDALADEALRMIVEEHRQAGKPVPDPDTLAKLTAAKVNAVLHPYRQDVFGRGIPQPDARVREARAYKRLAEKEQPPQTEVLSDSRRIEPQSAALPAPTMAAAPGAAPEPTPPTEGGY